MLKEKQVKLTEEIIETAYKLLTHKLAYGGLTYDEMPNIEFHKTDKNLTKSNGKT